MNDVLCIIDDSSTSGHVINEIQQLEPELGIEIVSEVSVALAWLETHACDCVLVCEGILAGEGRVHLREMRFRQAGVPVVILSNQPTGESVRAAFDWGADDFFPADCNEAERARQAYRIAQLSRNYRLNIESKRDEKSPREQFRNFQAIFDAAEDSIFIKDRDFRYTHVNPAIEALFSRPAVELVGQLDVDLFGPEAAAVIRETDERTLKGETVNAESEQEIEGVVYTFHLIKAPLRDSAGRIVGLFGIMRDVTDRNKALEELRKGEERYRLIVETTSQGVWMIDGRGKTTYVNQRMADMLGYTPEEMVGKSVFRFSDK